MIKKIIMKINAEFALFTWSCFVRFGGSGQKNYCVIFSSAGDWQAVLSYSMIIIIIISFNIRV